MSIVLGILTFFLILVSLFLILVILAQPAKSDGGMGAALGGGMAESAFGGETGNVLSKATINAAIAFFILSFLLYLGNVYERHHSAGASTALPSISTAPAATKPAPQPQQQTPAPPPSAPAPAPAPTKP